jgi:hypothetical protein
VKFCGSLVPENHDAPYFSLDRVHGAVANLVATSVAAEDMEVQKYHDKQGRMITTIFSLVGAQMRRMASEGGLNTSGYDQAKINADIAKDLRDTIKKLIINAVTQYGALDEYKQVWDVYQEWVSAPYGLVMEFDEAQSDGAVKVFKLPASISEFWIGRKLR